MDVVNWRTLAATLNTLTEQQVYDLLVAEQNGPKRPIILRRLHQRYTALRAVRERNEILNEAKK
jgi:arsenate reductase-like glutaredoxin family protein